MRPLVLCSNDDGVDAPHLNALADALEGFADVLVVAPERQRSAASHAITWDRYSLIIDGTARPGEDTILVSPTRAVLHRPAAVPGAHDCAEIGVTPE